MNECLTNNGGCHKDAICTDTIGSFSCSCKQGYSGDGMQCSKDESSSQAMKIGVSFGLMVSILLVLLTLFF